MQLAGNETDAGMSIQQLGYEPSTVVQLFERQCKRTPDVVAALSEGERLTYADLDKLSTQFAIYLRARSVVSGQFVGVCLRRSTRMLAALLGILKAGATYVPIDPQYPAQRIQFVVRDSGVNVVVTEEAVAGAFEGTGATVVRLDSEWKAVIATSESKQGTPSGPQDLAYVLYTSGTTGKPKGVAISHGSLTNLLSSMAREPGLTSSDVFLAVTTLCFDIAGLELYLPLITGARVVIASEAEARDPYEIASLIRKHGITAMQATPAMWRMLLSAGWKGQPSLKVLCGGEALPRDLANSLVDQMSSVWNLYGPTETTIWSSVERVRKQSGPVFIGRPIANTTFHILDEHGAPVPDGSPGDLYIGGAGLAVGYVNRPELTAERFVVREVNGARERLYHTGDQARRLSDGRFEYLGRKDTQVKLRGHRIELGEIESVLRQHTSVLDSVATARENGNGELQLVAYVVPRLQGRVPSAEELRLHAQNFLPEYMIPTSFIPLDALPLTSNGKIDRIGLTQAQIELPRRGTYVAPRNTLERQLVEIFESVLGAHPIGVTADFFASGGHSLTAAILLSKISEAFGKFLPLGTIFEAPTVEQLAKVLSNEDNENISSPLVRLQPLGSLPPFFCVHSQGSNIWTYRPLAELLGSNQPFYGLQPRSLAGRSEPLTRIEDLAADYIQELRTVQPAGPYYIGGVCLGGIIALEMAQQLQIAGEEVALVALIDSHFPGRPKHLPERAFGNSVLWTLDRHIGKLLVHSPLAALRLEIKTFRELLTRAFGGRKLPPVLASVIAANARAERAYLPQPYAGRLILFWCAEWSFRAYQDRRLGWEAIAEEGMEVYMVPGNHRSMLEHPNVTYLAEKLGKCLQRSRERIALNGRMIPREVSVDVHQ